MGIGGDWGIGDWGLGIDEDKIPLIIGLLEIFSKEDKNAKNIDFKDLFKNLPQFNEN